MAGDLEDFLRRAAQRRAENATIEQEQRDRAQQAAQRKRPEYTDRAAERAVTTAEDHDVVIAAELVHSEPELSRLKQQNPTKDAYSTPVSSVGSGTGTDYKQPTPHQAFDDLAVNRAGSSRNSDTQPIHQDQRTAAEIIQLFRSRQGIRQALMLREILDRPSHRW
ncbi:hypothetical protein SH139x_002548 [Planctomycetaceae bacterium SH139]